MKQANAQILGMTRVGGPITSVLAAEVAFRRRLTIRERVETFARFRPHGFLDCELFEFARDLALALGEPTPPESSARKRRTELCEENRIIASSETRKNDHDQEATVFYAREHMQNPPPIKAREAKPSRFAALQEECARLRAEVAAERAAVVAYLREIGDGDDDMHTWRYCQDMLAITFERGEHRHG